MIDSVIFDLDGTLLDTLDDLTVATNHALNAFGMGGISAERVRAFVGNGVPKLMERALYYATTGNALADNAAFEDRRLLNACLAVFTEYYDKHSSDYTAPYAGTCDLLASLKARGIKTAIVTNKYDAAAKELCSVFFKTVDAVVGVRDGIRPKPSSDGVNRALEILGSDKLRAVYVGDGETDMLTAAACDMPVVAVTWGFRDERVLREFNPNFIINNPDELIDALCAGGLIE